MNGYFLSRIDSVSKEGEKYIAYLNLDKKDRFCASKTQEHRATKFYKNITSKIIILKYL